MRRACAALLALTVACGDPALAAPAPAPAPATPTATATAPAPAPAPAPATATATAPAAVLTLEASGDLVLNDLAMRSVRAHPSEDAGYRALLDGYARTLTPGALTYINLEMPLIDTRVALDNGWPRSRAERPRRPPVLGASPALAPVLAALGVELVGLGNNHALDQDWAGLWSTIDALDAAGLAHAGAAPSPDAAHAGRIVEHDGHRVAFLSFAEFVNRRAADGPVGSIARLDPEEPMLAAVASARAEADLVVVAVHWSTDFLAEVRPSQRALARRIVDAGADVVLGTGPHVLQPVETIASPRGDAVIAYSLGNLTSGMGRAYRVGEVIEDPVHLANVSPEARDGAVLRLRISLGPPIAITADAALLFTANDWLLARDARAAVVRVLPLAELDAATCAERLPLMRAALGTTLPVVPDSCLH